MLSAYYRVQKIRHKWSDSLKFSVRLSAEGFWLFEKCRIWKIVEGSRSLKVKTTYISQNNSKIYF